MNLAACATSRNVVPNDRTREAGKVPTQPESRKLRPLADVFESESSYKIQLDLVAVNREEIAISVERDTLKISARRNAASAEVPLPATVYERDFALPDGVDRDGVSASYIAGVLEVLIPKKASERPRRVPVAAP